MGAYCLQISIDEVAMKWLLVSFALMVLMLCVSLVESVADDLRQGRDQD
jgi:hypothetical protein